MSLCLEEKVAIWSMRPPDAGVKLAVVSYGSLLEGTAFLKLKECRVHVVARIIQNKLQPSAAKLFDGSTDLL